MNYIKLAMSILVIFLAISILSASPASDNARTSNDMYENLLQREYTGPIPLSDHQVERKAVRSPSLRLRFGRRSDPALLPLGTKRFIQEVNQKPIRSPSLRLRFGRRSDPMVPVRPDETDYDMYDDDFNTLRLENSIKRAPAPRLRWGRNSLPTPNELFLNNDQWTLSENDKREPKYLHWGRNGFQSHQLFDSELDSTKNNEDKRRQPSERLRYGRNIDLSKLKDDIQALTSIDDITSN